MLTDEVEALANESVNLEELGRYQYCNRVLVVELWPSILLDSGAFFLLVTVLVRLLHLQLPSWRDTVANCFLELLLIRLLLLVLFHCKDVVKEPLKDSCVTMDRNIDLIIVTDFL